MNKIKILSSSEISRGNMSDLIGMFNNMPAEDSQQDSHHLTPRGVSGGSSLGADTNGSSVIRKSSLSSLDTQSYTSPYSSFLSSHENNRNHQIDLTKPKGYFLLSIHFYQTRFNYNDIHISQVLLVNNFICCQFRL